MADRQQRRLAAILAADIAGYSALMGADEARTLRDLKEHQAVILPMIDDHGGRVIDTAGDGVLAEFGSVVNAVECAVAIQETMAKRNADIEADRQIQFRIGINLGDVMYDETRIYGDGINVAARLESIAEPGGICLSNKVYEDVRGKVQLAYEDIGEQELKNISQLVRVYRVRATASPPAAKRLALPDKPSIAVMPFQNLSADPEQDYFADGMVEEIITALSRIRWLFVIARDSTFTYKGKTMDVKRIGRELGVRYVLEGSVRRAGNRLRITGRLIDAISSAHLWADHFEGTPQDVFELQDEVAAAVAGVIEPALQTAERSRSGQRSTKDLTSYDLYLRALSDTLLREKGRVLHALELLGQAIERDPQYGAALALAAKCHTDLHINGWTSDLEGSRRNGLTFARQALLVADDDPSVLANAAHVLGFFGEDIHAALALVDRALQLNPNFARGWVRSGWLRLWVGMPDVAIEHFETSIRLSPRERRVAHLGVGLGHFFAGRLDQAKAMLLQSLQEISTWPPTYRFLASCHAHMGHLDKAGDIVARLRDITPIVIPNVDHWRNPEHREFFLEGLRLAAGEAQ
jgi:TolB-like protein